MYFVNRCGQVVTGNTKSGDVIARVRATDADAGANAVLTYRLEGDADKMFSIAPDTGIIRLEKNRVRADTSSDEPDKEMIYHLVVVASDGGMHSCFVSTTTRSQAVARIADRTAKNCRGHVT